MRLRATLAFPPLVAGVAVVLDGSSAGAASTQSPVPGSPQLVSFSNLFVSSISTTVFHIVVSVPDGSAVSYRWSLDPLPCGRLAQPADNPETNGYYHGPDANHPAGCPPPPGIEIQTVVHVTVYRTVDGSPSGGIRAGAPYFTYSQVARAGDSPATASFAKLASVEYFGGGATAIAPAQPTAHASVSGTGANGGGQATAPTESTVSTSLPTPAAAFSNSLGFLLLNAVITLLLVLFVVFPSQLFNHTYEENHERIRAALERRMGWVARLRSGGDARLSAAQRGLLAFAGVVVGASLIGSLLDPAFGVNARTGTLIAGIALGLLVGSALGATVSWVYRGWAHLDRHWVLHALPSGLAVAAVCVLVSRLAGFQPGYLYGVIGGVAFAGQLSARQAGQSTLVSSVATLLIAVVAWLLWVPLHSGISSAPATAGFLPVLAENLLSALFVGGLVGTVIGLVPLRFLPGERLASWHRGAWAAAFAVSMFAVVQILLRPESSSTHAGSVPFWTTIGLFLAFGCGSVAFWWYFRVRAHPPGAQLEKEALVSAGTSATRRG